MGYLVIRVRNSVSWVHDTTPIAEIMQRFLEDGTHIEVLEYISHIPDDHADTVLIQQLNLWVDHIHNAEVQVPGLMEE